MEPLATALGRPASQPSPQGSHAFMDAFYQDHPLLLGVMELCEDDFLHIADNASAARFLGVRPGETEGRRSHELGVPAAAFLAWQGPCREAQRTNRPAFFEYEHETPAGVRIMSVFLAFLGYGPSGRPRFSYTVEDVTEPRRRSEETQRVETERATERRATEILQSITDGFYALDRDWRFTYVNREAEVLLQRSSEELIGQRFWDAFPVTVGLQVHQTFHEALKEQVTCELEEYYPPLNALFTARIYPSADGLSVYFRNITEQRKMEAALAEQHTQADLERRRLQATLNILPVGVFIIDARGKIIQGNEAGRAIWGHRTPASEAPDAYGEDYPAWRPATGERLKSHEWGVARALATGEVTVAEELLIEAGDGTRKTILSYALPVRSPEGELIGAVAVNVDITDRKQLEEALLRQAEDLTIADKAKDEFLAMLGHELRNPLGTIACATELMRRRFLHCEECQEPVEILQGQVRHMSRLLDDLLDVSRITTGRLELRRETVDLNLVLRKAVEGTQPVLEEHGHLLSVGYSEEPAWVDGDAARLQQVLGNLVNNAARYTPPCGRIWLSVEAHGDEVALRVRDNGDGIPADLLPRIFDLFTQAERPLDRAPGGLGIGLTLVRRLVEMHGGTVEAHSDGPGRGSEFLVRLPRIPNGRDAAHPVGCPTAATTPLRLLIVEDNSVARYTLRSVLTCEGHLVEVATDGPSALASARAWRPDVVLLDIGLPGMDGFEVARQMRQDPALRDTLLIAVTGYGQEVDHARSKEAGINEYLVKPLDFQHLGRFLSTVAASGA